MFGKILLTLDCLALVFGAPMADYNHTHIFNPNWPPHAKFHCGQTITLSICLGLITLFLTHRPDLPKSLAARDRRRDSLRLAAFTGSIYWLCGLAGYSFPGASGLDVEFGGPGFPQRNGFAAAAAMALVGGFVEGWM